MDPRRGVWTRGAVEINLRDGTDVDAILARANARRAVGATGLNADSSRSHLIIALSLERPRTAISSKLFLVDLAGAEKVRRSGAAGSRLDEACGINKSLSALGNVVAALTAAEGAEKTASAAERNDASLPRVFCESSAARESPHPHVPYRDSKLTRLLQEALGGDARATLVTCLSPNAADAAESLSTLRFGARARNVVGVAAPKIPENSRVLSEEAAAALRDELRSARDELARLRDDRAVVEVANGADEGGSGTGGVAREKSRAAKSTVPAPRTPRAPLGGVLRGGPRGVCRVTRVARGERKGTWAVVDHRVRGRARRDERGREGRATVRERVAERRRASTIRIPRRRSGRPE